MRRETFYTVLYFAVIVFVPYLAYRFGLTSSPAFAPLLFLAMLPLAIIDVCRFLRRRRRC